MAEQAHAPKSDLVSRAIRLEWTLAAYNVLEGIAAITFGLLAHSIALVGFGFDSAIEVTSASVVLWRLIWITDRRSHGPSFLAQSSGCDFVPEDGGFAPSR